MFDWWFISFRDNEIDLEKFNVRVFWWNIHPILDKFKYLKIKDIEKVCKMEKTEM